MLRMARLKHCLQRLVGQLDDGVRLFSHLGAAGASLPGVVLALHRSGATSPAEPRRPARRCRQRRCRQWPSTTGAVLVGPGAQQPADERRRRQQNGDLHQLFRLHEGLRCRRKSLRCGVGVRNGAVEGHRMRRCTGYSAMATDDMRTVILPCLGQTQLSVRKGNVFDSEFERNLFELRRGKLAEIEKLGQAAYPNQFPFSHTIPADSRQVGRDDRRRPRSQSCHGGHRRPHHGHSRAGQGGICHAAAGRRAAADLRAPRCRRRAGLCALQAARPGRPHRRHRLSVPHPDRRADRSTWSG